MLDEAILELESLVEMFNDKDKVKNLHVYYKNKFYLVVLNKQINNLVINMKSINSLINIGNVADAYTIFRKYLETYFIIMSVFENPDIVDKYMEHDLMLGKKACGKDLKEIRKIIKSKPQGYLEYGYLESKVQIDDNFKYTMYVVCEQAKLIEFHKWYKTCNNFVHNNLTFTNIDEEKGKDTLLEHCKESINYISNAFNKLLLSK